MFAALARRPLMSTLLVLATIAYNLLRATGAETFDTIADGAPAAAWATIEIREIGTCIDD